MQSVIDQLQAFIASPTKNIWLHDDKMKVYVRKARRCFDRENIITTFDIATIEVKVKGKGTFKEFIAKAHAAHPFQASFIESVLEPRLADWCERNGWTKFGENNYFLRK